MAGSAYRGWQGGLLGGGTDLSLLEFKVRMVASMNQFGKLYLPPPHCQPPNRGECTLVVLPTEIDADIWSTYIRYHLASIVSRNSG